MRSRCIVVGAGGHARVVMSLLLGERADELEVTLVADIHPTGSAESIFGIPVRPWGAEHAALFAAGIRTAFIAIGDNVARRAVFETLGSAGWHMPNLVARTAVVDPSARLGSANLVCSLAHLGPLVVLGDDNIVNTGADVEHESRIGSHCHLAPRSVLCGRVSVGDGCFLGAGSVVIDGVSVADSVTLGAGAVAVRDIGHSGGCHVGVPSRLVVRS